MKPPEIPSGFHPTEGWWTDLEERYATPARSYHTIAHVKEVLGHWSWVDADGGWSDRVSTWTAVLLHDAVYDVGHGDNEVRSAALVEPWCKRFGVAADTRRTATLIKLTANHGRQVKSSVDPEAALFLDCDMAILGAEAPRFDAYCAAVREEYAPIAPDAIYRAGRRQFLERLLAGDIFLTERFRERFEDQARENIRRALST